MRNGSIYLIFMTLVFINCTGSAQHRIKKNPFQMVEVPDSVRVKLYNFYKEEEDRETIKAGIYIFNLMDHNNYKFQNGIYSFRMMGPHFPRRIFIYNNGNMCILKSIGAFEPTELLKDYLECIKDLNLSDSEIRKYLKAISKYLEQEEGQTYGVR